MMFDYKNDFNHNYSIDKLEDNKNFKEIIQGNSF